MRAIIALKSDGDVRKSRAVPNMRLVYGGRLGGTSRPATVRQLQDGRQTLPYRIREGLPVMRDEQGLALASYSCT